jgi:hypothetical protein
LVVAGGKKTAAGTSMLNARKVTLDRQRFADEL